MKTYTLKPLKPNSPSSFDVSDLNPPQKEAVFHQLGPLLVIAGAGSGKTRTLVYRVARLVFDGIPPHRILLLTFTRKASDGMLNRASALLDQRCQTIAGGTFHSFANSILRQYGATIGYDKHFSILDQSDSQDLIQLIRKNMGLNKLDKRFPKKNTLLTIISKAFNTQTSIPTILSNDFPQFLDYSREIELIHTKYTAYKKDMQVMDYDDLLLKLLELLDTHPSIRHTLQENYDHILVDEYQDTNAIQAKIIQHLANSNHNVMVVGDDSQSIYAFRGANFKNIMSFPDLFPNTTIITLEENFRSTQPILDLTNSVIQHATEKYTKSLFTQNKGSLKPIYIQTDHDNMQSRFVCQKILELREEGIDLNDIAVLFRSGWHSNDLEVELRSHGIPFTKYGGFKFMETSHIKDVLSFFRVIHNPSDMISMQRLLLFLDKVGPKTATDIARSILEHKKTLDKQTLDKQALDKLDLSPYQSKPFYQDLLLFISLIQRSHLKTPSQLLPQILDFYIPFFQLKYDDFNKRKTDLDSLESIITRYDSIETLLTEMTLDPIDSSQLDSSQDDHEDEHLTLSTIHSAKGLEWHTVFLISVIDGYIPSFKSLHNNEQLEEERRLLYVALTRAKENLFIIKPNLSQGSHQAFYRYSGMQLSKLSRFLDDTDCIQTFTEQWCLRDDASTPTPLSDSTLSDFDSNSDYTSDLRFTSDLESDSTSNSESDSSSPRSHHKKYSL